MRKNKDINNKKHSKYICLSEKILLLLIYTLCVVSYVYGLSLAEFTGIEASSLCSGTQFSYVFQVTKTVTQYMLKITKTCTG